MEAPSLRCDLRPGDLGRVVEMHGVLYAREYGFDARFEAYVAHTLGELDLTSPPVARDRLWIAELDGRLVGSAGIVGREGGDAQLRWVLVHPDARGCGLGRRLLEEALGFCRGAGYRRVFLWTVHPLVNAARLYVRLGFALTEEKPAAPLWGLSLVEQRYDLTLGRPRAEC